MWKKVKSKRQTPRNEMTHNSKRRKAALKLWISKQGFSASGLGVHQGQRKEWADGMQKRVDSKGSHAENGILEKKSQMKNKNSGLVREAPRKPWYVNATKETRGACEEGEPSSRERGLRIPDLMASSGRRPLASAP